MSSNLVGLPQRYLRTARGCRVSSASSIRTLEKHRLYRLGAPLFKSRWSRRLSRRGPAGLGGSRRQGVHLRPRRRHRAAGKAP